MDIHKCEPEYQEYLFYPSNITSIKKTTLSPSPVAFTGPTSVSTHNPTHSQSSQTNYSLKCIETLSALPMQKNKMKIQNIKRSHGLGEEVCRLSKEQVDWNID